MFITLEGPEGAGKSTVIKTLASGLEAEGHDVFVTREPGGSEFGKKVRELLLHGDVQDHLAELMLFLADRADHVSSIIKPALANGSVVLCDRYSDSTVVYQGYARGLDIDFLIKLNEFVTRGLQPELTLLLDLPVEIGLARIKDKDRLDAEPIEFHQKVRAGFLSEMEKNPARWTIVDASQDPGIVADQCLEAVLKKLA